MEGSKRLGGLSYEDLCMHPDVEHPEGYKHPKFEMLNGIKNRKAHLQMYGDKLVRVGRDKKILMKFFMRSLTGMLYHGVLSNTLGNGLSGWTWKQTL